MTKRVPNKRLKALRSVANATQAQFASRVGISRVYVRSIETGQRNLTQSLANRISAAIGVCPRWLIGGGGEDSLPLTVLQEPYSPQDYLRKSPFLPQDPIDPDDDVSALIHELCHELTRLLRAAHRRGRFGQAVCYFREVRQEIEKTLRVDKSTDPTLVALQEFITGTIGPDRVLDEEMEILWRMLSPNGTLKWGEAFVGTEEDRDYFLSDYFRLWDLIVESFLSRSPAPPKPRKKKPVDQQR